jgi:hypothetical protein
MEDLFQVVSWRALRRQVYARALAEAGAAVVPALDDELPRILRESPYAALQEVGQ